MTQKLNSLTTGTRQQLDKTSIESITIGNTVIKPLESVRNLGYWFNAHMRMNVHIGKICSRAFRGLFSIRQIRTFLTVQSTKTLIHAFVSSHLDCCNDFFLIYLNINSIVYRKFTMLPLEWFFRWLNLIISDPHLSTYALHTIPVTFRAQFKLLIFVYKSLHKQSPPYIKDLLSMKPAANYALCLSAQSLLFFPKVSCSALGDWAFAHAAPVL